MFTMNQRVYLDCDEGLLPARVQGLPGGGRTLRLAVDGMAGRVAYDVAHVVTEEQKAEREAIAAELVGRS